MLRRERAATLLLVGALLPACREGSAAMADAGEPPATGQVAASAAETAAAAPDSPKATPEQAPEGMVAIPAGIFLMGAHEAVGNPEEKPAHEAIVAAFHLDLTEVRFADYQACVAAGACTPTKTDNRFCNARLENHGDHPVNCVDLRQADAYCRWAGKRLPSEREWEYAASGGGERRRFSWGDADPTPKNSCYDHPGGSCPVASFAPGAFGLYDMTGNVWEWTASKFEPYPSRATPDPIEDGAKYVYRGGSWSRRFPKWMRNLLRNRYRADQHSASIGIRCAKSVSPLTCPPDTEPRGEACVRVKGTMLCEPLYRAEDGRCVLDPAGAEAPAAASGDASHPSAPQPAADAKPVGAAITRTRTPEHDADCKQHWPSTPAAYLFKGGHNYPSRKPAVASAGCVPRDMGWSWTSACCPG